MGRDNEKERFRPFPNLYELKITPLKSLDFLAGKIQNPKINVLTVENTNSEIRHFRFEPLAGEPRYVPLLGFAYKFPNHVSVVNDTKLERKVIAKSSTKNLQNSKILQGSIENEARIACAVTHENVAVVHDLATDGRELYMISEYLPNGTLSEWIKETHSREEISFVVDGISKGLDHINKAGRLIYADMKPNNIGFDSENRPKIIDLELAIPINENGLALGNGRCTENYAAPEQLLNRQILSVRTDVYSLAATVFSIFLDINISEWSIGYLREVFVDNPQNIIPLRYEYQNLLSLNQILSISAVLRKALQMDPKDRYTSVKEFNDNFQQAINSRQ